MSAAVQIFAVLALAAVHVAALAIPAADQQGLDSRSSYPFTRLVAFGDELSDNGNGSYAHGITGDPANVYGFGTWTDGPVAVSYLADMLGVPLTDYAFGGCCGGGTIGAVTDNSWTTKAAKLNTGAPVPSLQEQIRSNYTVSSNDIKNSLQFIWIGQNDLPYQTDAFWEGDPLNAQFISGYSSRVVAEAEYLVSKGAPYVFVGNLYPKHLSPVTKTYLCPDGSCVDTWGKIISSANDALKAGLAASPNASKFIYWDSFKYISLLFNTKDAWGYTAAPDAICDGGPQAQWDTCIAGSHVWDGAQKFFWFDYVQPSTRAHWMIAMGMKSRIDTFFETGQ